MYWKISPIAMAAGRMEEDFFLNAKIVRSGAVQEREGLKTALIALNMPVESLKLSFEAIRQPN
jgi:hypothetical protein